MKMPAYSLTSPRPFPLVGLRQGRPGLKLDPRTAFGRFMPWVAAQVLWRGSVPRNTRLLSALPLLCLALLAEARGKVIPALKAPPQVSVFGTFPDVKPDYQHWGDEAVYGFSAGGMM